MQLPPPAEEALHLFLRQFGNPLILLLLFGAFLMVTLGQWTVHPSSAGVLSDMRANRIKRSEKSPTLAGFQWDTPRLTENLSQFDINQCVTPCGMVYWKQAFREAPHDAPEEGKRLSMGSYYSVLAGSDGPAMKLRLVGRWNVAALSRIEAELGAAPLQNLRTVTLDGSGLEMLDTSAAWFLNNLAQRLRKEKVSVEITNFQDNHRRTLERVAGLPHEAGPEKMSANFLERLFAAAGRRVVNIWNDSVSGITFLGQFLASLPGILRRPQTLRLRSVIFHVNDAGLNAVPIIALMAFSISFVTGYQGAYQLNKFDATIYTVDLIVLSTLREMSVLITAIMLAGRSGSAFAAQLGTMKLNEEVDALQTMGASPFQVLVLPRLLGILTALPLLTVIADLMGLLGGYVYMASFLNYSWLQYTSRMQEAADLKQFYVGLSKAPVFAILIGIVGCMQGLRPASSAEEVGRKTITAVVQSIFLVIVADAIFSVIFTKLGI